MHNIAVGEGEGETGRAVCDYVRGTSSPEVGWPVGAHLPRKRERGRASGDVSPVNRADVLGSRRGVNAGDEANLAEAAGKWLTINKRDDKVSAE